MSEIAFNMNGEPFDLPATMAAWRVRKLKPKGAPEVVYGRDGVPLFLPLDADVEDLRREARADGRYRLDPVDEHNRAVPNAQSSYVCVHPAERAQEPVAVAEPGVSQADTTAQLVSALLESQRQHTELARMYVSQFPVLVNALSGVVRSAGDAGLPARVPLVVPVAPEAKPAAPSTESSSNEDDDDSDDDDSDDDDSDDETVVEVIETEPESSEDRWLKFAMSALKVVEPHVGPLMGTLTGKLHKGAAGGQAGTPTGAGAPAADLGAHLDAIRAALTAEEVTLAMQITDELSIAEKLAHVNRLRAMSVPEAVGYLRGELARRGTAPERELSVAEVDAHVAAIRAALTAEESQALQLTLEELPSELRNGYRQQLASMSVPDAAAYARRQLAALGRSFTSPRRTDAPRTASAPTASRGDAPAAAPSKHSAHRATSSTPGVSRRDGLHGGRSAMAGSRAPASVASHPATSTTPDGILGVVSPTTQSHIAAIQDGLTPEEDVAVRTHLAAMSPADRSAWVSALLMLPVPEAVAAIRAALTSRRMSAVGPDAPTSSSVATAAAEPTPEAVLSAASPSIAASQVDHPGPGAEAMPANPEPLLAAAPVVTTATAPMQVGASVPVPAPVTIAAPTLTPIPAPEPITLVAPTSTPIPALEPITLVAPTPTPTPIPALVSATASVAALEPAADPMLGPATSTDALRPRDTDAHRHLGAIESALTPEERHFVYAMIAQMSPGERAAWLDRLVSVSVADAVAGLRDAIQEFLTEEIQIPDGTSGAPSRSSMSPPAQEASSHPALDTRHEVEDDQDEHEIEDDQDEHEIENDQDEHEVEDDQDEHEVEDDQDEHEVEEAKANEPADNGKAPKSSADARAGRAATTAPSRPATLPDQGLPTLDAATTARFRAIEQALGIEERMRLMELASQQPAAALRHWVAALAQLSVPEAVAKLRVVLAEANSPAGTKKAGVS